MYPQISSFLPSASIPPHFEYQIRTFLRIEWGEAGNHYFKEPLTDPVLKPVYFILADGEAIVSYGRVIRMEIHHAGQSYTLAGLGDVYTFPDFRGQGYGSQIVSAATEYIRTKLKVDDALLFTEPSLVPFYHRWGWRLVPTINFRYDSEPYEGVPLMLLLDEKVRAAFQGTTVLLPNDEW